jgi:hypothetical protein
MRNREGTRLAGGALYEGRYSNDGPERNKMRHDDLELTVHGRSHRRHGGSMGGPEPEHFVAMGPFPVAVPR